MHVTCKVTLLLNQPPKWMSECFRNVLRESKYPKFSGGACLATYIHSMTLVEVHNQRCNFPLPAQQLCKPPLGEAVYGPDIVLLHAYMHSRATQCKQAPIVQLCANRVMVVTFIHTRGHAHHVEHGRKMLQMHGFLIQTWENVKVQ